MFVFFNTENKLFVYLGKSKGNILISNSCLSINIYFVIYKYMHFRPYVGK